VGGEPTFADAAVNGKVAAISFTKGHLCALLAALA
jgi:hypothetical protein